MTTLFPYLSWKNLRRLFSSRGIELSNGNGSDSSDPSKLAIPCSLNLEKIDQKVLSEFGQMAQDFTHAGGVFISSSTGRVVWQHCELPLSVDAMKEDLLTHLRQAANGDVAMVHKPAAPESKPDGEAHFGAVVPVRTIKGELLGGLCILDEKDRNLEESEKTELKLIAGLLAEKLELAAKLQQLGAAQIAFQDFIRAGAGEHGLLASIAQTLCRLTKTEYAVIAEGWGESSRTVHVRFQSASIENFDYPIKGSPLDGLRVRQPMAKARRAAEEFPNDAWLRKNAIEGLAVLPIGDSQGHPCGWIGVFDRKPLDNAWVAEVLLEAAALPVAGELERSRLERDLRAQKARYQSLFEGATQGVYHLSEEGKLIGANPACAKLLGFGSADEMVSSCAGAFELPREFARWRNLLETQTEVRDEPADFSREGRSMWLTQTVRVRKDASAAFYEVFVEEVTHSRIAQELAVNWQARAEGLLETSSVAMAMTDAAGVIERTNLAFRQLLGFSEAEFRAKSLIDFSHPGEARDEAQLQSDLASGRRRTYQLEKRYVRKDGGFVCARVTVNRMDSGLMLIVLEDLTARRTAEAEAQAAGQKFRAAFENTAIGVVLGGPDGSITQANPAFCSWLNLKEPDVIGKALPDFAHFNDLEALKTAREDLIASRRDRVQHEGRFRGKDGGIRWGRVTCAALQGGDGNAKGWMALVEDTTRQHEAEEALRDHDKPFQELLGKAGYSVLGADAKGHIVSASPECEKLFDLDGGELLARKLGELFVDKDGKAMDAPEEFWRGAAPSFSLELFGKRPDQSRFCARLSGLGIRREDGQLHSAIFLVESLDEIRKAQAGWKAVTERFDSLFQHPALAVALLDSQGLFVECNAAFQELTGASQQELRYKSLSDLTMPEDAEALAQFARESRGSVELRMVNPQGGASWVRVTHAGVHSKEGAPEALIVVENLSRLKESEQSLEDHRERLESLVEEGSVPVAFLSAEGRIDRANPAWSSLVGATPRELTGKPLTKLLNAEHAEEFSRVQAQAAQGGRDRFQIEVRGPRPDGTRFSARLTWLSLADGG
ncbi:MAG: PAS domain-containing protein, partial [Verrucomicrobiae bacterium]|nr:PAS domain-containing protein [Verrucomicrobiae bacterium]